MEANTSDPTLATRKIVEAQTLTAMLAYRQQVIDEVVGLADARHDFEIYAGADGDPLQAAYCRGRQDALYDLIIRLQPKVPK